MMKSLRRREVLAAGMGGLVALPAPWLAGCTTAPGPGGMGTATSSSASAQGPWTNQPLFSIVRVEIRDAKGFGDYALGHTPTIAAVGGRFIAAGALPDTVEGQWPARRMVIHQWTSAQVFFDWYNGSAYAPWKRMRRAASHSDFVLVQGVASSAPVAEVPPAFVLIETEVRDAAAHARHLQGQAASLRAAGGEILVAGGRLEVIEGDWTPKRLDLQRWPTAAAFRSWYLSSEYRPWREMRQAAAHTNVALLVGLSEKMKIERRMP